MLLRLVQQTGCQAVGKGDSKEDCEVDSCVGPVVGGAFLQVNATATEGSPVSASVPCFYDANHPDRYVELRDTPESPGWFMFFGVALAIIPTLMLLAGVCYGCYLGCGAPGPCEEPPSTDFYRIPGWSISGGGREWFPRTQWF